MRLPSFTATPSWLFPKKKKKRNKKKIHTTATHVCPVRRHVINIELMPLFRPRDHKSPVFPSTALAATQAVLWSHGENIEFYFHDMKGENKMSANHNLICPFAA